MFSRCCSVACPCGVSWSASPAAWKYSSPPSPQYSSSSSVYKKYEITYVTSWDKTSHMLQKIKWQKFAFFSENVKICPFFVFTKNKIFVQVSVILINFCTLLLNFYAFFSFSGIIIIYDETQFFFFKAIFLIILDF